uniref:Glutaredoxin domain-containing protein n=1 Tax=viral metagenome TaxID=1070528 RepID=A0A6C0K1K7_9ZZZZ
MKNLGFSFFKDKQKMSQTWTQPPDEGFFAYLLQSCPFSKKVAKFLSLPQKKWVRRNSDAFHTMREQYDWPTFPIVFYNGQLLGGSEEFIDLVNSFEE